MERNSITLILIGSSARSNVPINIASIKTKIMDRKSIENYKVSMIHLKALFKQGTIDEKTFKEMEEELAKKYGIKKLSLYRDTIG